MEYVTGFMFSEDKRRVAMIRKNRPERQAGFLNGIGGKVGDLAPGESGITAMVREFYEESGYLTIPKQWVSLGTMLRDIPWNPKNNFCIWVYYTIGPVDELKTMTDEPIEIIPVASILSRSDIFDNAAPLITMSLQHMKFAPRTFKFKVIYGDN